MTIRIGGNRPATMSALRNASQQRDEEKKSPEKLSSGQRINRAADDAAGLAVANRMGEVLKGLEQGMANVYDGVSLASTADAGLASTTDNLGRMRELAVAAANDTLSVDQRDAIQAEFSALASEVDRTAGSLEFNGKKLLDGSGGSIEIRTGEGADPAGGSITMDFSQPMDAMALGVGGLDLSGANGDAARAAVAVIDGALEEVGGRRAELGAASNRLMSAGQGLAVAAENTYASRSRIMDTDFAAETAERTRRQIQAQAGDAVLVQGRLMPSSVMSLLE